VKRYRHELDILRFTAFLGVFVSHAVPFSTLLRHRHVPTAVGSILQALERAGGFGVNVFFILSAYLITTLLLDERQRYGGVAIGTFYIRRALRIWPIYFLTILAIVLFPVLDPDHEFTARYVIPMLLFAGNWALISFGGLWSPAAPLWSISVEEQFYLLWPPLLERLPKQHIVGVAFVFVATAYVTRLIEWLIGASFHHSWGNTFSHLDALGAGILIAAGTIDRFPKLSMRCRAGLLLAGFACCFVQSWSSDLPDELPITLPAALFGYPLATAGCVAIFVAFLGAPIRSRSLEYLGRISYGLYVYHLACIFVVQSLHPRTPAVRLGLDFALTVVVAAASYHFIEQPILRLKKRFEPSAVARTISVSRPTEQA
jgi:peptidoglycan/LPS O-acetylase OafA/YrhL